MLVRRLLKGSLGQSFVRTKDFERVLKVRVCKRKGHAAP